MAPASEKVQPRHSQLLSYILLAAALFACLLPFYGKAFNIDDTLFLYVARQITQHLLDPFGFKVNWFLDAVPMAYETKNPPFAAYYIAAAATLVGWSERALHLAFLLPALAVVWGTYRLAQRFTNSPLLAAAATLFTPAFLVSANSVMCDTMMVAFWLWAIIFWIEGLEPQKPGYLALSALLITLCALTKYFGAALILLLAAYSLARLRRFGSWTWHLLLPILVLAGYQHWTKAIYGVRMITSAAHLSTGMRQARRASTLAKTLVDLSFVGGCALPALTVAPIIWRRARILAVCFASGIAGFLISTGRMSLGAAIWPFDFYRHWFVVGIQLTLFIAAGLSVIALPITDTAKRRDADSLLLLLWIFGTVIFTGFVNWMINVRSVLPLIPAVGILLARRIDTIDAMSTLRPSSRNGRAAMLVIALAMAGAVSLWLTWADADMANSGRTAATLIEQKTRNQPGTVWFMGHWGFQYYMESFGAHAVIVDDPPRRAGDFLAVAARDKLFEVRPQFVASCEVIQIPMNLAITTAQRELGTGFYGADWGPLPFAIGPVPPERYTLIHLRSSPASTSNSQNNFLQCQ
jgi:4-amino-4-deoxy-L-arabinose transferase-like glycosyltransferase